MDISDGSPALESYASELDLRKRLIGCLAFAERTVRRADVEHDLWRVDLGQVSGLEKMFMEASLLAFIVGRSETLSTEANDLAHAVRTAYDSRPALMNIMRQPRCATSLGSILLVFDHFGLATEQELDVLRTALDSPFSESSEHVPFRLLDRRWILGLAGRASVFADVDVLTLTTGCRTTHPIYMTREDIYALTHSVMYATDFGALEPPAQLGSTRLWHTVDSCLAWSLAIRDYDVVAELLFTQLMLRRRFSSYGVVAWRRCIQAWRSHGFLPSPSISPDAFGALTSDADREQYALHNMYHTILVGGLVCHALLTFGVEAPADEPFTIDLIDLDVLEQAIARTRALVEDTFGVDGATASAVLARVQWTADQQWRDELASKWKQDLLDDDTQSVAERMATDAFITDRAREYDLAGVAAGLRRACVENTVTQTVCVGADFLARQTTLNGGVSALMLGREAFERNELASATALTNALMRVAALLGTPAGLP